MDWSVAVPVRPVAVPGAGDSPGASTSRRVNGPPLTFVALEVSGRTAGWLRSRAQMRCPPVA